DTEAATVIGDDQVGDAVAVGVAQCRGNGSAAGRPQPWPEGRAPGAVAVVAAQEDGDVVGTGVRHQQVGDAVAVDVLDGYARGSRPDRVGTGRCEGGVAGGVEAGGLVDQYVVAAGAQHHRVEQGAVPVQPGPRRGARRQPA